ncbi:hypothetical protein E2C01_058795 [Portunus trituberculatus]|uniref:Uncharacterized protein n=1 Tax=Portunus trituberculatus TaxID=210409 RepID=A0A5B7H555_PORTR|nr:hypothetical protein [Portunus trituberculatus]
MKEKSSWICCIKSHHEAGGTDYHINHLRTPEAGHVHADPELGINGRIPRVPFPTTDLYCPVQDTLVPTLPWD